MSGLDVVEVVVNDLHARWLVKVVEVMPEKLGDCLLSLVSVYPARPA